VISQIRIGPAGRRVLMKGFSVAYSVRMLGRIFAGATRFGLKVLLFTSWPSARSSTADFSSSGRMVGAIQRPNVSYRQHCGCRPCTLVF